MVDYFIRTSSRNIHNYSAMLLNSFNERISPSTESNQYQCRSKCKDSGNNVKCARGRFDLTIDVCRRLEATINARTQTDEGGNEWYFINCSTSLSMTLALRRFTMSLHLHYCHSSYHRLIARSPFFHNHRHIYDFPTRRVDHKRSLFSCWET